ncbi:MAG: DMT family transporter [Gammaproteobacteria bacterium]
MRGFALGLAAAASATIIWGVQLPLARDAFAIVDPFHITALRYLLAALCLVPVLAWREGLAALSYRGGGLTASWLGVVGMCASPMLVFLGMSYSSAEHAVVIVSLQPAMAALAYWLLRGARPAAFTLLCIAGAFVGVMLVVTGGAIGFAESASQVAGDLVVMLGAGCWVVYTMGIGRLHGWSTWRITVLTMIPGALATSVLTACLVAVGYLQPTSVEALSAVAFEIAFLTFAGVLLAMLAWNFGTRRVGAINATLLINCMPVTTFVYRSLQGHAFAPAELAGAALVVAALIANNLYLRRRALAVDLAARE